MGVARRRALASWVCVAFAMTLGACVSAPQFQCAESAQCTQGGTCEASGFCSFPDPSCDSGQRYSDLAGAGLKNSCVGMETADAGITIVDEAPKLTSISFSSPYTEADPFDANEAEYPVDVSLLAREIRLTLVADTGAATILVNGVEVDGQSESGPVTLNLGENSIVVKVTGPEGQSNTYVAKVTRAAKTIEQVEYVKTSNTVEKIFLGKRVALSGDTLVVGALGDGNAATGINQLPVGAAPNSGAVYVFRKSSVGWEQEAYIKAHNTSEDSTFGFSVALSGDSLAVGAPMEGTSLAGAGAVYTFTRTGTVWTQEDFIRRLGAEAFDGFGHSVALSGDTLAVGAPAADITGQVENTGVVNVYLRGTGGWSTETALGGEADGDKFGGSVALEGDRLVVGAENEGTGGQGSGAAYIYERTGALWNSGLMIKASNADEFDRFGACVSLSADTLVVGAPLEDSISGAQEDNTSLDKGAAYVFRLEQGSWMQEAYLKASNIAGSQRFGTSVAINGDRIAVGAPQTDSTVGEGGAVYLFRAGPGVWSPEELVQASNRAAGDRLGESVAISSDAMAVGASGEDSISEGVGSDQTDNSASDSGAVYLFQ